LKVVDVSVNDCAFALWIPAGNVNSADAAKHTLAKDPLLIMDAILANWLEKRDLIAG
jgi:hypothetical protein